VTLKDLGASPRNRWRVSAAQVDLTRAHAQPRPLSVPSGERMLTLDMARTAGSATAALT
jgi:hypothetical protein